MSNQPCIKYGGNSFCFYLTLIATIWALGGPVSGQTPEEHSQHHSSGSTNTVSAPSAMGRNQPMGGEGGGMDAGMGEMMKQMGVPARKELYPSLMALPDEVTAEDLSRIEQLAHERMQAGAALLSSALGKLSDSTSDEDYAAMQQAAVQVREGLAEFEAGIAARRVLSEGQAPRNLALDWFKREMNLASPIPPEGAGTFLGVKPFHLFTMALLIAFALAMLAMYYFKMRRAAALFGRLGPDSNPPPGSSPPLGGTPGPSGPVAPSLGAATSSSVSGTPEVRDMTPIGSSASHIPRGDAAKSAADKPLPPPAAKGSPLATLPVGEAAPVPTMTANWHGQLRVGSVVTETPSVKTLRFLPSSSNHLIPFVFLPGQFLNVSLWIGGARMNRSYTISSSPTQREYVELTIRREPRGAVSRHICDLLKVGDQCEAGGPVGHFTFTGTEADSIVLISGGVGITPMMSITRYLTECSWFGDIYFIHTCRTPADFIFADEVALLQRLNPKLHVAVTVSDAEGIDWKGHRGLISKEWLTQMVPDLASRTSHLCGPPPMMDSIKAIFAELGIPPDRLKTEAFGTPRPAPSAAGTTAKPTIPATGPLVIFSKNNKSAKIHVDQTVLELSEELGIGIAFACRVGTCGVCKVKMTSGEVAMAVQDALNPEDKASGIILACQAKPKVDIVVEA